MALMRRITLWTPTTATSSWSPPTPPTPQGYHPGRLLILNPPFFRCCTHSAELRVRLQAAAAYVRAPLISGAAARAWGQVDTGKTEFGGEIQFRGQFEGCASFPRGGEFERRVADAIRKQELGWHGSQDGWGASFDVAGIGRRLGDTAGMGPEQNLSICLVFEGGPGTIRTAHSAVLNRTPVMLMYGSGRAADLLSDALRIFESEGTGDPLLPPPLLLFTPQPPLNFSRLSPTGRPSSPPPPFPLSGDLRQRPSPSAPQRTPPPPPPRHHRPAPAPPFGPICPPAPQLPE
jgi:hypothetical protein